MTTAISPVHLIKERIRSVNRLQIALGIPLLVTAAAVTVIIAEGTPFSYSWRRRNNPLEIQLWLRVDRFGRLLFYLSEAAGSGFPAG